MTTSPSPTFSSVESEEVIKKLNMAVEGENAAVWAFSYLLSFIPDENKEYAFSIFNLHRDNRDKLRLRLRNLGLTPPRPKENYELPIVVKDMVTAYELASFIENRLIGIYIQLYAIENESQRVETLQYALDGAIRILDFKQTPIALPGSIV
ncbi:MAG: hypothetical protein RIS18_683 [Actinomycetota bacterium]